MSFLKVLLEALFSSLLDGLRAYQADRKLEELGYEKGLREAATAEIKAKDAVISAQERMSAVPAADRASTVDSLHRGGF